MTLHTSAGAGIKGARPCARPPALSQDKTLLHVPSSPFIWLFATFVNFKYNFEPFFFLFRHLASHLRCPHFTYLLPFFLLPKKGRAPKSHKHKSLSTHFLSVRILSANVSCLRRAETPALRFFRASIGCNRIVVVKTSTLAFVLVSDCANTVARVLIDTFREISVTFGAVCNSSA